MRKADRVGNKYVSIAQNIMTFRVEHVSMYVWVVIVLLHIHVDDGSGGMIA